MTFSAHFRHNLIVPRSGADLEPPHDRRRQRRPDQPGPLRRLAGVAHSASCGSHTEAKPALSAQVIDQVDRTLQCANRPILIEGGLLPVRLTRSRSTKAAQ